MKLSHIAPQQLNEEDDANDAGYASEREIPASLVDHLRNEIDKLNRRAAKIGSPEIEMDVSQPFFRKVKDDNGNEKEEKYVTVTVDGPPPHVPGFEFLATIQHKSGGNVIRTMPGVDESNVKNFYEAKPEYCDHCKKKRARIDTFLIRDQQTGDLRQIGRNCLADFLGGKDPKQVLFWFSIKDRVGKILDDADNYSGKLRGRAEYAVGNDRVLSVAAAIIKHYGYLSRAKAQYGETTTASIVWQVIFGSSSYLKGDELKQYKEYISIVKGAGEKEAKYTHDVLSWWNDELTDDEKNENNFYHNIDVVLKSDHVTPRDIGILTAIYPAYERVKGDSNRKKEAEKKSNEWIGNPKEKLEKTRVKVTNIRWMENNYQYNAPDNQLVKMEDEAGNSYTWWNSSKHVMEEDTTYDIVGTIKKHDDYRGRKTTVLIRVKPVEV